MLNFFSLYNNLYHDVIITRDFGGTFEKPSLVILYLLNINWKEHVRKHFELTPLKGVKSL